MKKAIESVMPSRPPSVMSSRLPTVMSSTSCSVTSLISSGSSDYCRKGIDYIERSTMVTPCKIIISYY